jgi:hypothetical protein
MVDYFLYEKEYGIFKPTEITIRMGQRLKGKNRGDEPIWVIIPIYFKIYMRYMRKLMYHKQKCHFIYFFFYKIREQDVRACHV